MEMIKNNFANDRADMEKRMSLTLEDFEDVYMGIGLQVGLKLSAQICEKSE